MELVCSLLRVGEGEDYRQLIVLSLRLIRLCSPCASSTEANDSSVEVTNFMTTMAFILSEINVCVIDSVGLLQRSLLGVLDQ